MLFFQTYSYVFIGIVVSGYIHTFNIHYFAIVKKWRVTANGEM